MPTPTTSRWTTACAIYIVFTLISGCYPPKCGERVLIDSTAARGLINNRRYRSTFQTTRRSTRLRSNTANTVVASPTIIPYIIDACIHQPDVAKLITRNTTASASFILSTKTRAQVEANLQEELSVHYRNKMLQKTRVISQVAPALTVSKILKFQICYPEKVGQDH